VATAAALAVTIALHEAAHCAVARPRRPRCTTHHAVLPRRLAGADGAAATPTVEARVALAGLLASVVAALVASVAHVVFVSADVDPLLAAAAAVVAIAKPARGRLQLHPRAAARRAWRALHARCGP